MDKAGHSCKFEIPFYHFIRLFETTYEKERKRMKERKRERMREKERDRKRKREKINSKFVTVACQFDSYFYISILYTFSLSSIERKTFILSPSICDMNMSVFFNKNKPAKKSVLFSTK